MHAPLLIAGHFVWSLRWRCCCPANLANAVTSGHHSTAERYQNDELELMEEPSLRDSPSNTEVRMSVIDLYVHIRLNACMWYNFAIERIRRSCGCRRANVSLVSKASLDVIMQQAAAPMEGQQGPGGSMAPADAAAGPSSAGAEADGLWVPDEYVEVRLTQSLASVGIASPGGRHCWANLVTVT